MKSTEILYLKLERIRNVAFAAGGIAFVLGLAGGALGWEQFFRSYLHAYLFWFGLVLGCLGIVMLHNIVGGAWGYVIRRFLESAIRTLPALALLFLPILYGMHGLYIWAQPERVAQDPLLQHKSPYLNVSGFVGRAALYFFLWIALVHFMNKYWSEQERSGDSSSGRWLRMISAPGIVVYMVTITFASIDWAMSLEPHWFSTIYGALFMTEQGVTSFAFVILLLGCMSKYEPFAKVVSPKHFHDLGNLTLAFVMLWAYMTFSQFLIIWSGNLPEEISWYVHRAHGGWQWLALVLAVFHFAIPFLLLLFRSVKRGVGPLVTLAAGLLVMRWVGLYWLIAPAFHPESLRLHWADPVAFLAIGGTWIGVFLWHLRRRSLLPVHDIYLEARGNHD